MFQDYFFNPLSAKPVAALGTGGNAGYLRKISFVV